MSDRDEEIDNISVKKEKRSHDDDNANNNDSLKRKQSTQNVKGAKKSKKDKEQVKKREEEEETIETVPTKSTPVEDVDMSLLLNTDTEDNMMQDSNKKKKKQSNVQAPHPTPTPSSRPSTPMEYNTSLNINHDVLDDDSDKKVDQEKDNEYEFVEPVSKVHPKGKGKKIKESIQSIKQKSLDDDHDDHHSDGDIHMEGETNSLLNMNEKETPKKNLYNKTTPLKTILQEKMQVQPARQEKSHSKGQNGKKVQSKNRDVEQEVEPVEIGVDSIDSADAVDEEEKDNPEFVLITTMHQYTCIKLQGLLRKVNDTIEHPKCMLDEQTTYSNNVVISYMDIFREIYKFIDLISKNRTNQTIRDESFDSITNLISNNKEMKKYVQYIKRNC